MMETVNVEDIIIFWLKIIVGIFAGISYYFLLRFAFLILYQFDNAFLIAFSIPILIVIHFLISHLLILLLIFLIKKFKSRSIFSKKELWKYSLDHFILFIAIIFLSSSIIFYLNL